MSRIIGKKGSWRSSIFWISVISGMASLVVMVALLQYRWTKQLIEATETGMGNSLRPLTIGWHLDFYGELSAICVALQVGPDSGAHDGWSDYLQRYTEWSQAVASDSEETVAPNPDLVEAVYVWETTNKAKPRLLRLIPEDKKIESTEVPPRLETLLARLQATSSTLPEALRAWQRNGITAKEPSTDLRTMPSQDLPRWSGAMIGWQFDENIPAVVHPLLHHLRPLDSQSPVRGGAVDWIVVVLNRSIIRQRIIPALAQRYFGGPAGLEYKLAVVESGQTPQIVYSSDAEFPSGDGADLDSRLNIFGPSSDTGQTHDWRTGKSEPLPPRGNSFSGLVWFPVIEYGPQDAPWMLLLQHRTTPLQTIAADIWRRNILTGGVVLLLLTIDMGLIVIASRRAHNLAKLQLNFVASVSHELLTPLAAIYCTGQNAMDGLIQAKQDLIEHGSIITGQTRQLIDLVRQILMFASTDSGTSRYSLRPLGVQEILECVRKDVAVLVEASGFTLEEHVEAGLPFAMGDLRALSHCLQNLIANAVKYSGKSKWISVSASAHYLAGHPEEIWITVRDRGVGISESDLQHIFEPFYRSAKSVDAQIHGTGLGLAVAKRIAEAMEGRLSVTSELGVGSAFTLHLTVAKQWDARLSEQPALSRST
jgi:signal transduction histidine kinase